MKPIDRRTVFKSSGVALGLPLLECMSSSRAESALSQPPQRMVFVCTALGLYGPHLWPQTAGADYELTPYLKILEKHRADFTLFSGLQHEDQGGRQPHDSEMTWLTSARKPGMSGFRNSVSVDQVAAAHATGLTRYPSLSLGTLNSQSQSYTSGGVMIPAQTDPADLFASLFVQGRPEHVQAQKQRLNDGQSILDHLNVQAKQLQRKASTADSHLMEDYFESIREAERRIADQQGWLKKPKPDIAARPPEVIHNDADLVGRLQLLMEMVPLILQSDSSRVVSIMIHNLVQVPKIKGVTGGHHNLSHHGQDEAKIEQLQMVESRIVACFGNLLDQLKSRKESGVSLLQNTSTLFGSNLGNANSHDTDNLPVILAGGGYSHGTFSVQKDGTPLSNLFVSMLHQMGIEADAFGQSSGTLSWS